MIDGQPKAWFRPKRIGWGWTPQTWQGWVVTIGGALAIAGIARLLQ